MARREGIEEAVGTVGEALRQGMTQHPSGRELAAYHHEELSSTEMEALRDHLSMCPECSELLLDLSGFEQLGQGAEARRWTQRQPAVWQALQSNLTASETQRTPVSVASGRNVLQPRWLPLAMAAALVLAVGAAIWLTLDLGRTREQLAVAAEQLARAELRIDTFGQTATTMEPLLVVPSLDLFPPGYQRGGEMKPNLTVPPQADLFVLQLHVAETKSEADHRLRILTPGGVEVWAGNGLRRTPGGTFRVAVPRSFLPSGRYRLELYDVEESSTQPLAQYDLAIAYR